jgi:hypothetical protein
MPTDLTFDDFDSDGTMDASDSFPFDANQQ